MKLLSVGTDPEGWYYDGDNLVPAFYLVDNDKEAGGIHWDNAAVEVAIPPSETEDQFVETVTEWRQAVEKIGTDYGLQTLWKPTAFIPKRYLADTRSMVAGCDPDWCAYTMKRNPRPKFEGALRSAGGHIHIGYEGDTTPAAHKAIIKALEIRHGMVDVLFNGDPARFRLYGSAGSFRPKPYGLEARSPTAWWITDEKFIRFTWRAVKAAVEDSSLLVGKFADVFIQRVITQRDQGAAESILASCGLENPL
jgi:hypothetical protein